MSETKQILPSVGKMKNDKRGDNAEKGMNASYGKATKAGGESCVNYPVRFTWVPLEWHLNPKPKVCHQHKCPHIRFQPMCFHTHYQMNSMLHYNFSCTIWKRSFGTVLHEINLLAWPIFQNLISLSVSMSCQVNSNHFPFTPLFSLYNKPGLVTILIWLILPHFCSVLHCFALYVKLMFLTTAHAMKSHMVL